MSKFDDVVQALLLNTNQKLSEPITTAQLVTYVTETELNCFITGYLIGSGKYRDDDDVFSYIHSLKVKYPDFGKFSSHLGY